MSQSSITQIETPAVILDQAKLDANLNAMQQLADQHRVQLRPHVKTHKSLEIGRRQIALGASGITVATVDEACVFLAGGFKSITIARPVISPKKLTRLFSSAASGEEIRIVVDSQAGYEVISAGCSAASGPVGILIKIDVGLHRCGLQEDDRELIPLAKRIHEASDLDFRGILSHAGHAYAAQSREAVGGIAEQERQLMLKVRETLMGQGIPVPEISVGATPAVLGAGSFEGITEIRPGNYVFLDMLPINAGVARVEDVSLSVLATVISKNDTYLITDSGSKTLTSDAGVHGMTGTRGFGRAYPVDHFPDPDYAMIVEKVSEEHGILGRGPDDLPIGSQVRIIPNHACPVANLAREYVVLNKEGMSTWPVDASRCSR